MLGRLHWQSGGYTFLPGVADSLEFDLTRVPLDTNPSVQLAELNSCGDWHELALEAVHYVIASEEQLSPPYYRVQCYRHTSGDRTLVIQQTVDLWSTQSTSVFVYRTSEDHGGTFDLRYSVRDLQDRSWPDIHLAVLNDSIVGFVMVLNDQQNVATIQFFSLEGQRSQPVRLRALFGMQKPGNQEFLAFEEEFPSDGGPGRAVFTRYGAKALRIESLPVELMRNDPSGPTLGGTSLRIATDRFRDLLHQFWLHTWRIHHIPRLWYASERSAGDDVVLSQLELDPDSAGPGSTASWPHDQRDSQSPPPSDPLKECPVTFDVSPAMETKHIPTRDPVLCNLVIGVEGWQVKIRQRKSDDEYPPYSYWVRVLDSEFSEVVRTSGFFVSPANLKRARPTPGSTELHPPFDHPNPETADDWCVSVVGGRGCGAEYIIGENWSGYLAEGSKNYRSEAGYGIVGTTCIAIIEGRWGLSVVIHGVGGCAAVREVLETLRFPDEPVE